MESEPENNNEKEKEEEGVINYERMGAMERGANVLAEFLKERDVKREAKKQEKREKKLKSKGEFNEHIEREREKKIEAARALGAVNASQVEKVGVVSDNKEKTEKTEKTVGESIWTLLWGTPLVLVASKHEKLKANAKNTLLEPFRWKSISQLFKDIGKGLK